MVQSYGLNVFYFQLTYQNYQHSICQKYKAVSFFSIAGNACC